MFLNVTQNINYMTPKTIIPSSKDYFGYTAPPRNGGRTNYGIGVSLVAQYIESFLFRRKEYAKIKDANLKEMSDKAYQLDCGNSDIITPSEKYPSCGSIMQAAIDLEYVNHVNGIGYVRPSVNDIKYFLYQYGGIILECKATDKTLNMTDTKLGYTLCDGGIGTVQSEDVSKGFIACGYDSTYLYLQNNLGLYIGSCGYHRIAWSVVPQVAIKGCCFKLT